MAGEPNLRSLLRDQRSRSRFGRGRGRLPGGSCSRQSRPVGSPRMTPSPIPYMRWQRGCEERPIRFPKSCVRAGARLASAELAVVAAFQGEVRMLKVLRHDENSPL